MNYQIIPGLPKKNPTHIPAAAIIQLVANYFKVDNFFTPENIIRKNRKREIVTARQMAILLLRKNTPLSLKSIGDLFGKDHTTVIHSIRTMTDLIFVDEALAKDFTFINNKINN